MTQKYDYAVLIGRFQPFHRGHAEVIEHGLKIARKVIVLVGSANRPQGLRNPFSFEERAQMIREWWHPRMMTAFSDRASDDLILQPLPDAAYDDEEWVQNVQHAVRMATSKDVAPRIALIGSDKDNSTYYLRLFPQWSYEPIAQAEKLNATAIRAAYFEGGNHLTDQGFGAWLPATTLEFLLRWRGKSTFADLMKEQEFITGYRKEWGTGPFMAVDAVVIQSGHVLLVERGRPPGVGKMALPGGFLDPDETLLQGALRELEEETGLHIGIEESRYLLRAKEIFDDVHRSPRARMITTAFLFELPPGPLPRVKGGDDAADARWVEIAALRTDEMFSDHAFMISKLLKLKG